MPASFLYSPDEKSDCASCTPDLISAFLIFSSANALYLHTITSNAQGHLLLADLHGDDVVIGYARQ